MARTALRSQWSQLFRQPQAAGLSLQGRVPKGGRLTSCRELSQELGVARNTVVLAYQQLVDEGYLVVRDRRGYFAAEGISTYRSRRAVPDTPAPAPADEWSRRFTRRPSLQRQIVKPPDWLKFPYPFIYGQFDSQLIPIAGWRECVQNALSVLEIQGWVADRVDTDDPLLVEQIQSRLLPARGVWAAPEEILVTVGAQHALYLLADLLVGPHTTVGIEDPGYPDARNIFTARTNDVRGLKVDTQGLVVDDAVAGCQYLYVTPSHQSPTTVTMPMARREALLAMAARTGAIIIEDDYDSELSFSGAPNPALKSMDRDGRVLYISSLSKTLAPGLRLGFIVGPKELIREARALRRLMIRHPATNNQRAIALFLALGHHDSHLRKLIDAYRDRAQALGAALHQHLPGSIQQINRGGSSYWVKGPLGLDAEVLAQEAAQRGVLIEPGRIFFLQEEAPRHFFRLGYASIAVEKIEPGVRLLAEAVAAAGRSKR
jgi:GntR family transcriptional regulator/MocR family aminotransferase